VSARPFIPRLSDEELDLLLSRSLDGDLSPEEEHGLETLLAHDPAAARRKEELGRLVAEARALPAPAPPFALATRVNSNVSEKAGSGGSVFHRFGFYPPPGMAVGAATLLGIVVVAITVLKPAPLRIAQREEGPVDVFLTEGESAANRPRPAPAAVVASAPPLAAAAGQAAGIAAPAAKASGALANAVNARAWSVAVRGEGARRWMLHSAPEGRPSAASSQASAFRVTLDADGRVTSVRALDARPVQPALLEFVRGLVFAPVGATGGAGAVAEGIVRDEKAKAERADALADRPAENPSEIDVEVSAR
jgi:hypothetical protein